MRAGPKGQIAVEPLDFTGWPADRAARRERFISEFLIVPRGHGAGEPFRLREFQSKIISGAFAPGVRTGLVSMPRANGKTMLAAALAIAELWVGPPSAEALVVASDQRQANITLRYARRMIELNPALAERCHIFADRLYVPETDSLLLPLPAEPGALHGHDPALLVVDELHVVTEDVWTAVTSAAGKRPESLTLAISTPATSPDCVMWSLVEHGRAGDHPAFYFEEYGAPEGWATDDRDAWKVANPALACVDPFLAEDGIEAVRRTLREPVFWQLRLGQWVTGAGAWLPWVSGPTARTRPGWSQTRSGSYSRSTAPHLGTRRPWSAAPSRTRTCLSSGFGRIRATPAGVSRVAKLIMLWLWRLTGGTWPSWPVTRGAGCRKSSSGRGGTASPGARVEYGERSADGT